MKYEYYWLKNYITLISERQIEIDLEKRTSIFNSLGEKGWVFLPTLSGKGNYCFKRPYNPELRKQYLYYWMRHFIPLYSDGQIQDDLNTRSKIFNDLNLENWDLVMGELDMFCFMKENTNVK